MSSVSVSMDTSVSNASGQPVFNETETVEATISGENSYSSTNELHVEMAGTTYMESEQLFPGSFTRTISEGLGPGTYTVEAEVYATERDYELGNDPIASDSVTFVVREYSPPETSDPDSGQDQEEDTTSGEQPSEEDPGTQPSDGEDTEQTSGFPPETGFQGSRLTIVLFLVAVGIGLWYLKNSSGRTWGSQK